MDLGRALAWTAERFPDRVAIGGERSYSYADWDQRTNRLARAYAALGAGRGDRIALVAANSELLATAHLAAQKLGACSTPLNTRFSVEDMAYCLADCSPAIVVGDDATGPLLRAALERLDEGDGRFAVVHAGSDRPEGAQSLEHLIEAQGDGLPAVRVSDGDLSVMLYTSGTTGRPKGVPRTQRNEWSAAVAHVIQARYRSGESTLGAMPLYHTMGLRSLLSMLVVGGKFVPLPTTFDPGRAMELVARERISSLYLVPTAYWTLVQDAGFADAASTVDRLAYAGAAMTSSLTETLQAAVRPEVFINHYGSTEVYTFTVEENAAERPGSAGRPGVFSRMRIVRAEAEERVAPDDLAEPGTVGELIASLDSEESFSGYWNRSDADEKQLRDGWYFTGDLGHVAPDGRFCVAGRVDDMVITGGENVHPLEVEDAIGRCPSVSEVAVAGLFDEKWGQAVTAFVVPPEDRDADAVAEEVGTWVRAERGLAGYKKPKRIVVLAEIPKSPVGKLLRRKLQAGEYEPLAATAAPPSETARK